MNKQVIRALMKWMQQTADSLSYGQVVVTVKLRDGQIASARRDLCEQKKPEDLLKDTETSD